MNLLIKSLVRNATAIVCLVGLVSVSPDSAASGSLSVPSAGGSSSQRYQLGKVTLYRKLLCSNCISPKEKLDSEKAGQLVKRLRFDKTLSEILTLDERKAVAIYLSRRYAINNG